MVSDEGSSSGTYILVPTNYGPHIQADCRLVLAQTGYLEIQYLRILGDHWKMLWDYKRLLKIIGSFCRDSHAWIIVDCIHQISNIWEVMRCHYQQYNIYNPLSPRREACHYVKDSNPDPEQLFCFVLRTGPTAAKKWPTCQNHSVFINTNASTDTEGNIASCTLRVMLYFQLLFSASMRLYKRSS